MERTVYKNELYRNQKIRICRSPVQGWGVFTKEDIAKYEILEESPIIIVDNEELGNPHNLIRYFASLKGHHSQFIGLGSGSLYNHSADPNVEWYVDGVNYIQIYYAIKDIKAGEELFSCYNPNINFENS